MKPFVTPLTAMLSALLLPLLRPPSIDALSIPRRLSRMTARRSHNVDSSLPPSALAAKVSASSAAALATTPGAVPFPLGLAALFFRSKSKSERQRQRQKMMYSVPSIFTPTDSRPVVLFDGKCNLCNAGVQLLLDYDRATNDARGDLRVAALQSRVGAVLLDRLPREVRETVLTTPATAEGGEHNRQSDDDDDEEEEDYKSILVCTPTKTYTQTSAVLRIGRSMNKFPIRQLCLVAYLIPPFLRNRLYGVISRNRKALSRRFFGGEREEGCRLWDDNWDQRFVDDALLGGRGSSDPFADPFADPNAPPADNDNDDDDADSVLAAADFEVGSRVRVVSPTPVVLTRRNHGVPSDHPEGVCVSGCVGKVVTNKIFCTVEFDESELFGNGGDASKDRGGEDTEGTTGEEAAEKTKKFRAYLTAGQLVLV